jgi:hypothetical protein
MAKRAKALTQSDFRHVWHLQDWMRSAEKRQADLQKELGWSKAKAHDVWHGQQYTQALIDELAPWLNVRPYELLMTVEEANAIRQLRRSAAQIVHEQPLAAIMMGVAGDKKAS